MHLADRMSRLGTESAFDVLVKARALEQLGKSVIHLEIGEPDFPTPAHVVEAGQRALEEGWTKYGPTAGSPRAPRGNRRLCFAHAGGEGDGRERVRRAWRQANHVLYDDGALERGDEVIYPESGLSPSTNRSSSFSARRQCRFRSWRSRGFSFDLDVLQSRLSERTRLVILNSPANPTGGVIPPDDLAQIADLLRDRDLVVLSDEIYSRIWYDAEPASIVGFDGLLEKTVILDGFSKTYAMTGWRLGYGVMPAWLAQAVNRLMVNSNSCTAAFTQRAGLAALEGPQDCVTAMVEQFRQRRDVMVEGLNAIPGFRCSRPAGAFYAFPNVSGTGLRCGELADLLLTEAGVACLAGTAFGAYGDGYLRFSYANSLSNIQDAIGRIGRLADRWAR